jgi:hypothetical protein
MHERFPELEALTSGRWQFTNEQTLDSTSAGYAATQETRRKDPRVVQDEEVAGLKVIAKLRKNGMLVVTAVAMQYEQP